jgi:arylsulfatase A-like enzyme
MSKLLDKRWPWVVVAIAAIGLFLSTFLEVHIGGDDDPRPIGSAEDIAALAQRQDTNVLFVLIDTLRADRLKTYGYSRDTDPQIDRLASSGVVFRRHLAQSSWTKCSMASLWTGMYPARSGITRFDDIIPEAARMPAEILKDAGFQTIGIFRNGWVAPTFGFEQGFDTYLRPAPRPLPPSVRMENPTITAKGTDEDAVAAAIEFLRVRGDQRWFLYVHLMDVHEYLYDEESALFGGSYSDVYDNAVRWTDGALGALLEYLAEEGYTKNTVVVIAADHGEAFRERGLEGHARQVYRETTEIPLILSFPFRLEPRVDVTVRTRNVDVWPTILDLIGMEPMADTDGRSLVPEILASARGEGPAEAERMGISHLDQHWGQRTEAPLPTVAVTEGSLRYVRVDEADHRVEQLFDASVDPGELHDRSREDPATVERLRKVADAYLEEQPTWGAVPKREVGEMELNQLRALGYAIP